ncbi:hypothetical protein QAD02_019809, partial [Eretmocerus hayati]
MAQEPSKSKELCKIALAEVLGTAVLLFLGCMGCVGGLGMEPTHLQATFNFGLTVLIVIQCFGHISEAHINPAVTVGAVVLGKKTIPEAMVYFVSQFFGAILGFGMLKVITPSDLLKAKENASTDSFCVTQLNHVHPIQGLLIEGLSTAILMLVVCAIWDSRNAHNTDSTAIKFGLVVTCLANAVGPYTGCSMNPARSFAPALWNNYWNDHWIYWFGPLGGSLLATLGYKSVFGVDNSDEDHLSENVALNSVEPRKPE